MSTALIIFGLLIAVAVALWASSDDLGRAIRVTRGVGDGQKGAEMVANTSDARPGEPPGRRGNARVVVTDFDMPFGSMVWFMVKLGVASLPAVIILAVLGFILSIPATVAIVSLAKVLGWAPPYPAP